MLHVFPMCGFLTPETLRGEAMSRRFFLVLLACAWPLLVHAEPESPMEALGKALAPVEFYRIAGIEGSVRDAETGKPIKGASVFARRDVRERETVRYHGRNITSRCAGWQSVQTDAAGRYEIDSYGVTVGWGKDLESTGTSVWIVAPGYREYAGRDSSVSLERHTGSLDAAELIESLRGCGYDGADYSQAADGLATLFLASDIDTMDYDTRAKMNWLGRVAVHEQSVFKSRAVDDPGLSNEIIHMVLSGNAELADRHIKLRNAVFNGDTSGTRRLLQQVNDANRDTGFRRSLRWQALINGHHETYRALVEHGVPWREGEPQDAIHVLTQKNDVPGLRTLASEGIAAKPKSGFMVESPFLDAIGRGQVGAVRGMLDAGTDPDMRNRGGSALERALDRNQPEIFAMLIECGADPRTVDDRGRQIFELAHYKGAAYVAPLLKTGVRPDAFVRGNDPLADAILHDKEDLVQLYLEYRFDPVTGESTSSFATAARRGRVDLLERMLWSPDVQFGTDAWWHALSRSATRESTDALDFLLSMADKPLTGPSAKRGCPACNAAREGRIEAVKKLLAHGVPVDARKADGGTAFMYAVGGKELEIVDFLLARGANINAAGNDGRTALITMADNGGSFRREYAAKYAGQPETTVTSSPGTSPQQVTFTPPDLEDRASHEAPPQSRSITVLQPAGAIQLSATRAGLVPPKPVSLPLLDRLLAAGADPNLQDNKGWTALMYAAARGDDVFVERLLAAGAKPGIRNGERETAANIARRLGHAETAKRLAP